MAPAEISTKRLTSAQAEQQAWAIGEDEIDECGRFVVEKERRLLNMLVKSTQSNCFYKSTLLVILGISAPKSVCVPDDARVIEIPAHD